MSVSNQNPANEPETLLQKILFVVRNYFGQKSFRRDAGPIDSRAEVERYAATRAAFITQKKLYGYLKTRMGTQYTKVFENDTFVQSISIANHHIYTAALSDLTIFVIAQALDGTDALSDDEKAGFALECYQSGLAENRDGRPESLVEEDVIKAFEERLAETDWNGSALAADNFTASPKALIHWAPIAPNLKKYDKEIVENSMKYAWLDIRARYLKRLKRDSVQLDFLAGR